ncbi:HAD-IA family hydrolase [Candidatus Babeliales bacterium]|nr:HAD-IA family hydrolase [Candidatus Babeliales bacterium]
MNLRRYLSIVFFVWILMSVIPDIQAKILVFDIGGVLLRTNTKKAMNLMGYGNLVSYTFSFHNPVNLQEKSFNALRTIKDLSIRPNHEKSTYLGTPLPDIMAAWLRGDIPCQKLLAMAQTAVLDKIQSKTTRAIFSAIYHSMFDPKTNCSIQEFVPTALQLVRDLRKETDAAGNRIHKFYILSNYNDEAFRELYLNNTDIFDELFDGLLISGDVGLIKPDPAIYKLLLTEYNLDVDDCYFIDDQIENVHAATSVGFTGIHCNNFNYLQIRQRLIKDKLLTLSTSTRRTTPRKPKSKKAQVQHKDTALTATFT